MHAGAAALAALPLLLFHALSFGLPEGSIRPTLIVNCCRHLINLNSSPHSFYAYQYYPLPL
jgi:hypothetical protein